MPIAVAGVMQGLLAETVLLLVSLETETTWRRRLNIQGPVRLLKPLTSTLPLVSAACAGAAAGLCGVIDEACLTEAVRQAFEGAEEKLMTQNIETALAAYAEHKPDGGIVKPSMESSASDYQKPDWIDLPLESAELSAPTIHGAQTSIKVRTGLWRTRRPVIDPELCNRCWWVCSSSCPDGVINIGPDQRPVIDYEHCKGCMICVAQCPAHAISSIPEAQAQQEEKS